MPRSRSSFTTSPCKRPEYARRLRLTVRNHCSLRFTRCDGQAPMPGAGGAICAFEGIRCRWAATEVKGLADCDAVSGATYSIAGGRSTIANAVRVCSPWLRLKANGHSHASSVRHTLQQGQEQHMHSEGQRGVPVELQACTAPALQRSSFVRY